MCEIDLDLQQKRVVLVMERLLNMVREDEDDALVIGEYLDVMLNELKESDFFGTEGQLDPRGDFREDTWDIEYVQGIDVV